MMRAMPVPGSWRTAADAGGRMAGGRMEMPIAWDGYTRVDYVAEAGRRPERGQLQVSLATVETTVQAGVRPGLRAGFVVGDPEGPPTFIVVRLSQRRLSADIRDLLGAGLSAVAEQVVAGPPHSRWTRLDLTAVDALAAVWAPYRHRVLSDAAAPRDGTDDWPDHDLPADDWPDDDEADEHGPGGARPARGGRSAGTRTGAWGDGLWALIAADDLRASMTELAASGQLSLLGGDDHADAGDDTGADRSPQDRVGGWPIPAEVAARAGIEPALRWEIRGGQVHVAATPVAGWTGEPAVEVSFDDAAGRWSPLLRAPDGWLRAVIGSTADPEGLPAVRIRVRGPEATS